MTIDHAILATLAYHDIFDYPLTADEIHNYLIGKKASRSSISFSLVILDPASAGDRISNRGNLYALKKRRNLFPLRKLRAKYSQSKLKRAKFYSRLLSSIPTVLFVGITGALAMNNSKKNDDIDLLVITSKDTLWTTRFLANIVLFPFKRKPIHKLNSKLLTLNANNKACLNLFLDDSDLEIKDQNLYTAHEITQLKPILNRKGTYSQFIRANHWVKKFLPNWNASSVFIDHRSEKSRLLTMNYPLRTIENFLKNFQLAYMKSKISTERIGDTQLFFHPKNTQDWVLKEYQKRLRRLKLV